MNMSNRIALTLLLCLVVIWLFKSNKTENSNIKPFFSSISDSKISLAVTALKQFPIAQEKLEPSTLGVVTNSKGPINSSYYLQIVSIDGHVIVLHLNSTQTKLCSLAEKIFLSDRNSYSVVVVPKYDIAEKYCFSPHSVCIKGKIIANLKHPSTAMLGPKELVTYTNEVYDCI